MTGFSFNARIGEAIEEPRSLFRPVIVLAGLVILAAGASAIQGVFATVAFGVLAAIVCREIQLALKRRGLVNVAYARGLIDRDRRGFEDNGMLIWTLLTWEIWFQTFVDRGAVTAPVNTSRQTVNGSALQPVEQVS